MGAPRPGPHEAEEPGLGGPPEDRPAGCGLVAPRGPGRPLCLRGACCEDHASRPGRRGGPPDGLE
eukprot:12565149-Alexandrium_andersonii.AAC.1